VSELIFVGTSDAFGAGGRRQSAIVLRCDEGSILLDCAPTTGTGLAALGIARDSIDAIAISHFHADHFSGIPQFLLAANFEDLRERPLEVVGPPGIEDRVFRLAEVMGHNLRHGLRFPLRFREFSDGDAEEGIPVGPVQMSTFTTRHQLETEPHALVLRWADKHIVYSGDTGWFPELPDRVGSADLFVCECTFFEREFEYHLNYRTLRDQAAAFRCGRIVLTHFSEEMTHRRGALDFECADDGTRIAL
jgi:ribonuclease BN (tRNA processing enzyme)